MSTERNAPCPCGSGKKYKKCCLDKDQVAARVAAADAARAAEEKRKAEAAALEAERERLHREWEEDREGIPDTDPLELISGFEQQPTPTADPDWPPLSAHDQELVEAWWEEITPVYTGSERLKERGWLLERTLAFLDKHPRLFRYLYLDEEFLLDLGDILEPSEHSDDFLAFLRRLRVEQPEMYLHCFGYCDTRLIVGALRKRRPQDISGYLDLFRQHPVRDVDALARLVNVLAWRGCDQELRKLLEPTATAIADSPRVIRGEFGLEWLSDLTLFPFLESGDVSPAALERVCDAVFAVDFLIKGDRQNHVWLSHVLNMASRSAAEAGLDLKDTRNSYLHMDTAWNFAGWLRRTKGLSWAAARFLGKSLEQYWAGSGKGKKPTSPFRLSQTYLREHVDERLETYFGLDSIRALATFQAFHYFTEYLVAHGYFSEADATLLQKATADLYESSREQVDSSDAAYLICPTYESLV